MIVYPRAKNDWYVEPRWCVEALLAYEKFEGIIYDPACGRGNITDVAKQFGYFVLASDIEDRGCEYAWRGDFLDPLPNDIGRTVDNIVCNPPYRLAHKFIERALTVTRRKVAMLVQEKYPYSRRRHWFFTHTPIARLYFLSDRPSMPPGDLYVAGKIKASGGKVDYLWMVWDHAHMGPPTAHWLCKPGVIYSHGKARSS